MADAVFTTMPGALLRRFLRAAAAEVSAFAAAAGPPLRSPVRSPLGARSSA
jgi:hypothetical protein